MGCKQRGRGTVQLSAYCTTGTRRPGSGYVPDMRVSLYPGRSTEAPPGETAGASWDEGWLPGATGVTLWLWLARQVPTMSPVGA